MSDDHTPTRVMPLRAGILHLIQQQGPLANEDILAKLEPTYGGEGQFKPSLVDIHLEALRAAGLVDEIACTLNADHQPSTTYRVTEAGIKRLRWVTKRR